MGSPTGFYQPKAGSILDIDRAFYDRLATNTDHFELARHGHDDCPDVPHGRATRASGHLADAAMPCTSFSAPV